MSTWIDKSAKRIELLTLIAAKLLKAMAVELVERGEDLAGGRLAEIAGEAKAFGRRPRYDAEMKEWMAEPSGPCPAIFRAADTIDLQADSIARSLLEGSREERPVPQTDPTISQPGHHSRSRVKRNRSRKTSRAKLSK